ncbi:hypothetical protein RE628_14315 [Paenibacillus sp. D2_2]|uniref:hypothetical protein n=1 Tax=Paenibacillus sp. D2_2 TaxID=3073092 RepID=UPI00281677A0|nr:hypothetical protein [Paenibacillus sp. D2_2]WMT43311.1 hypothetical protein RE628_14315 [Paenibacillus sp. D2_2]
MIVFNKHSYLGTDEKVEDIDKKIGQIKYSSDNEENMKADSFSNYYPVGTKLYKIKGINEGAAIAVELEKDIYIKAYNKKK